MDDKYPYNDDLLIEGKDYDNAGKIYPGISFSLRFPQLIDELQDCDVKALKAKAVLRVLGLSAVGMVLTSLTAASAAPFYHGNHFWAGIIITAAAFTGVLGGAIGLGLFSARSKEAWLENRLVVECLRQFHFMLMIRLAPDIIAIASSRQNGKPTEHTNALIRSSNASGPLPCLSWCPIWSDGKQRSLLPSLKPVKRARLLECSPCHQQKPSTARPVRSCCRLMGPYG